MMKDRYERIAHINVCGTSREKDIDKGVIKVYAVWEHVIVVGKRDQNPC